jgi:hypothetical protein
MLNNPQAWYALRAKVQTATAGLTDQQLTERTAKQQRRWRDHKRAASFDILQELHTEQHRRRFQ